MTLLDESGFARCTLPAVADRLGVELNELVAHFPSQDVLYAELGKAMARAADKQVMTAAKSGDEPSWRDLLRRRALSARAAMLTHRDGALLFSALDELPALNGADHDPATGLCEVGFSLYDARAALQLIDSFAVGWVLSEQARGRQADDADSTDQVSYADQIETLLAGIAATRAWGGTATKHHMFQPRLWIFLRNVRDSANIAFSRADDVNELDRRILLQLKAQGALTLASISTGLGVDKAQVSRSIKRLNEIGLIERSGIRNPLKLSEAGRAMTERLTRLANLRNRELAFGIADEQLVDLFGVLDTLLERALTLYEQERKASAGLQKQEGDIDFPDIIDEGERDAAGRIPVDRSRILPPFITLCAYVMRGAALGYKRKTGLSNFDSWVLSEVCYRPPISWPQLVVTLYRDQSQAGRTVKRLIEFGLIERTGKPGRRHGFFSPTDEGRRISSIINSMTARRTEFLFQGIAQLQLDNFMDAFDILSRNAEVQLAREKAIQEMDRDDEEARSSNPRWVNPAAV